MANEMAQRQAVADLAQLARADLALTAPALVDATTGDARAALVEVLPGLGAEYGDTAATIAMDHYLDERVQAEAPGSYTPLLPTGPGFPRYRSLALWGTDIGKDANELLDVDDVGRILARVGGGLQRTIADHYRQTIVDTSIADPGALGWGRVGVGDNCDFCNRLISRGEIYKQATVTFRSHDGCNCISAPAFANTKIFVPGKGVNLPTLGADTVGDVADVAADVAEEVAPAAGLLSPEQYASMLPDSRWSEEKRNAILAQLRSTENGKILADTLDKFQDGGSIGRIRSSIDKRLAGEAISGMSARRADALIDALRHAPSDAVPEKLYRGMSVSGSQKTVLAKYVPGEDLDLNLTSFSSDRAIATKFQKMTRKKGSTDVMVELIGDGKVGIPIQNLARDRRLFKEKEWVSAGKYEIVETKKSPSGGVILRVRQKGRI